MQIGAVAVIAATPVAKFIALFPASCRAVLLSGLACYFFFFLIVVFVWQRLGWPWPWFGLVVVLDGGDCIC